MRFLASVFILVGAVLIGAGCGDRKTEPEQGSKTIKGRLEKVKPTKKLP
jgi:hypothetical protein